MKRKTSISAFTILEVLAVLVITSLVIYLGFLLINSNQSYLVGFDQHVEESQAQQFCKSRFQSEFLRAKTIEKTMNGFLFSGKDPIHVIVQDSIITFDNQISGELTTYDAAIEYMEIEVQENLVKTLKLYILQANQKTIQWTFHKEYDQFTLLENSLQ